MDDSKRMAQDKKTYKIIVQEKNQLKNIACGQGENLLDAMVRQDVYMSAACGKRGTCGKCVIQLLEGDLEVTGFDHKKLTMEELEKGYRLSCKAYPKGDCTIQLLTDNEDEFQVVTEYKNTLKLKVKKDGNYALGIDIGTTTIAISLIDVAHGNIIDTYSAVNRQRAYGADVIARIQASNGGKKEELKKSIQRDLLQGIKEIISKTKVSKEQIQKITIAANTTMGHLLLGFSCETLGVYPFTPVDISEMTLPFAQVLESDYLDVPIIILPGISTFVGGDISAGLLVCEFDKKEKPCLLVDLGTNGEMGIGNKDRIIVTSTAAGPAFEGGNISCGVGSIPGAICNIDGIDGDLQVKTIGDSAPVGICGTGVIEMVSELVKANLIDETGLLDEKYFEDGYLLAKDPTGKPITFIQKDVREIQLAKAAIRAGVELLIRRYGVDYEDIDTLYLAGGFGYKMNIEKALEVGLLPKELAGKVKAIGNSSLGGAILYAHDKEAGKRMEDLLKNTSEINLSNDKDFNELYVDYMFFDVD